MKDSTLKIIPIDNEQLSYKTKLALIELIKTGSPDGRPFKLPNEDELSQRLGVSRNVLRDALGSLEDMGIVTRRRGKGTLANPALADISCRLDAEPELQSTFENAGYAVKIDTLRLGFVYRNDPSFCPGLDCDAYLTVEKLFTIESGAAAYCADHIAAQYVRRAENQISALNNMSHYQFLSKYCGIPMAYTMAHIDIAIAEPWLSSLMGLPEKEPLLLMNDQVYSLDHEMIGFTQIYFRRGILDLKFLRRNF